MPLITIKPPRRPSTTSQSTQHSASPPAIGPSAFERERSPEAPPASPLTPILKAANLATDHIALDVPAGAGASQHLPENSRITATPQQVQQQQQQQQRHSGSNVRSPRLIDRPPPLPFSGEDSTDAIALRAAISSLQFQRAKAQKDLRTLEEIKNQAVDNPEEFRQHVLLSASKPATGRQQGEKWVPPPDFDNSDSDDDDDAVIGAEREESSGTAASRRSFSGLDEIPDSQQTPGGSSFGSVFASQHKPIKAHTSQHFGFAEIPGPQNVVRCPPIEWAKYHIVGESLDNLHKEQQTRPGVGGFSGRESVITAPYNPFIDRFESEERSVREQQQSQGQRKDSGASAPEQAGLRRRSSKAFLDTN